MRNYYTGDIFRGEKLLFLLHVRKKKKKGDKEKGKKKGKKEKRKEKGKRKKEKKGKR